jgi:hypothetical protein
MAQGLGEATCLAGCGCKQKNKRRKGRKKKKYQTEETSRKSDDALASGNKHIPEPGIASMDLSS